MLEIRGREVNEGEGREGGEAVNEGMGRMRADNWGKGCIGERER